MFRLKSVYIKDYKNIHDQTFDFSESNGYVALIGLNGSGKSNLLEAISLIFKGLLFDKKKVPFDYKITYEIDGTEYFRKNGQAKINGVIASGGEMLYPSSVIACYSGEDTRLWKEAYEPYYMQYFKKAVRDVTYYPRIMYINKYSWKTAFIALVCSSKENAKQFLRDNLGIADIRNVTIRFVVDAAKRETFQDHYACRWYDSLKALQDQNAQDEINANEIASTDMMMFGARTNEDPARVFQFLYLLSMPERNEEGQTIDKLITDIKIKIGDVDFDNLSEGEKKMILIECITQILADDNSLVLLDEPDAHVHVGNKKKILDAIEQFKGQTVLTTHSPSICKYIPTKDAIMFLNHGVGSIVNNQFDAAKTLVPEEQLFYMLFTTKHIVLTEGKTDCLYIKKAIELFRALYPTLHNQTDFISVGGTDPDCVNEILARIPNIDNRKIVVLVDRDGGGLKCAKGVLHNDNLRKEDLNTERNISKPNTMLLMLPNNRGDQEDFVIEDYFSNTTIRAITIKEIVEDFEQNSTFNSFPKVKNDLKEKLLPSLAAQCTSASYMEGFKVLLNKLETLLH
jgi:ABC-type cobalamin/Fe3+-siderophores transport system ATPase subunit